jgi:hypothetical protein
MSTRWCAFELRRVADDSPLVTHMAKPYAKPRELTSVVRDGFTLEVDRATSERMAGVRQKGTKPELIVRRILRRLGIHYRVANRSLPSSSGS